MSLLLEDDDDDDDNKDDDEVVSPLSLVMTKSCELGSTTTSFLLLVTSLEIALQHEL